MMRKYLGGRYLEIQGRDPKKFRGDSKKSGKLIAVLCCFCEWFDFGVLCGFGMGLRATGTLPLPVGVGFGVEASMC